MYNSLRLRFRALNARGSIIGLSVASVGAFLYSRRVIRADSSEEEAGGLIIYTLFVEPGKLATPTVIYHHSKPTQTEHEQMHDSSSDLDEKMVKAQLNRLSGSGTITGNGDVGIRRFDSIAVPSSAPRLDTTTLSSHSMSHGSCWTIIGLHQGFLKYGWTTMETVSRNLHAAVLGGLMDIFQKYQPDSEHSDIGAVVTENGPCEEEVDQDRFERAVHHTFKEKFLEVDRTIIQSPFEPLPSSQPSPKPVAIAAMNAALSGCSSLVAFYDHEPRKLRVANAGNVRAVLGRRSMPKKEGRDVYHAHVLSEDHTSDTAPGLSRAFGAGPYKWSRDIQDQLHRDYMGDPPVDHPPHIVLTAEPSVTTIDVKPGDFLVLATRGLWSSLTNEEVVGLVGLWLNRGMFSAKDELQASKDVLMPSDLPVPTSTDNTVMYKRWGVEKRFICVDNNVAQHLARNALGGAERSWTSILLSHRPPRSLHLREDINVTVVFFHDES
ncbi:Phosphatase 2C like protein [Termitomyces sp. T112]|nr:Phosphatase 2C like protein [Termitomyces sp. T112]